MDFGDVLGQVMLRESSVVSRKCQEDIPLSESDFKLYLITLRYSMKEERHMF